VGRLIPKKKTTIVEKSENISIDNKNMPDSTASTIQEAIEEIDAKITLLRQLSE